MNGKIAYVALALAMAVFAGARPCAGASGAAAAALPDVQVVELTLAGAVFQTPEPTGRDMDLMLELERTDGLWQRATGIAREYNTSVHTGYVEEARIDERAAELGVAMQIVGDSWVSGGPAMYRVKLARGGDGRLEGTYEGTFKGRTVSGRATGCIFTRKYIMGKDFTPLAPGEHPRTVFRKSDLVRLREKLKTPFGQAAFAKMTGPVGWGVQHQLTGDAKYARAAQDEVAEIIFKGKGCSAAFAPARALGCQVERVAVALDLCWDAWPEPFKMQVITWLRKIATRVFCDPRKISLSANWNVASNHVGSLYAGVAFAGLVLWGEKGQTPPQPTPPALVFDIPAALDYQPGKGVPVVPLAPGVVPRKWLATAPIETVIATDPIVSVQGLEKIRPEAGETIRLEDYELTFQPLRDEYVDAAENNILLKSFMNDRETATFCFYTVLDVREGGLYRLRNACSNSGRTQLLLNGHRLADGQVVRLEKGLYPVLILGRMMIAWTKFQPRFEAAGQDDLEQAKALLAQEDRQFKARLREWEIDVAESRRLGGASAEYNTLFRTGRRIMYTLYREAVGSGGFQAEVAHYNKDTTDGPNRYAAAFRRCFGYDVSPHPDITHYLTRNAFVYIYPEQGKPWAQDINGSVHIGGDYFAALFPICPEAWQAAMLWAWDRMECAPGDASKASAVADDPAWGFAAYPLDMSAQAPAGSLPLVWEAPDFGFYAFRNSWAGGDDIVTQFFLKSHHIGGWNGPNAGTFRIAGLGKTWAVGPDGRERRRWNESVIWLPSDDTYESALGQLTYLKTEKNGSGAVTMDLKDVYSGPPQGRLYAPYGGARHDRAFQDSGISGLRSFGVDYSGKCGAPALFVVVDKVRGGHEKVWLWQVPRTGTSEKQTKMVDVVVKDNTFAIRQGDATLAATFVAPAPVKLAAETRKMQIRKSAGHEAGKAIDVTFDAVFAEGGDDFFVVATLQRGPPPPVKAEGRGLDSKVRVGGRTVAFDGQKVVFGQ
ncbi:MAG: hypothetical protein FJ288_16700 [Planctomycetes bacterium]|nr:hypothetical protein [Planctomycetota bacterium]